MKPLIAKTASRASGGFFKTGFTLAKWGSFSIVLLFVFLSAVMQSIDQRSWEPILTQVANKILLTASDLADQSRLIIEKGDIYDYSNGFWKGLYAAAGSISGLIFAMFAVWAWIKAFAWLYARTPFSFPGNTFVNQFMAAVIFFVFQTMASLAAAGIAHELTSFSDAAEVMKQPFVALVLLIKALTVVFAPAAEAAQKTADGMVNESIRNGQILTNLTNISGS